MLRVDQRQEFEAVGVFEFYVEDHDIGLGVIKGSLQSRTTFSFGDREVALEHRANQLPNGLFVVNE